MVKRVLDEVGNIWTTSQREKEVNTVSKREDKKVKGVFFNKYQPY